MIIETIAADGVRGNVQSLTDASGIASLPRISSDHARIYVRAQGYLGENRRLSGAAATSPLAFRLQRLGAITGRVLSADDEVVDGADVALVTRGGGGTDLSLLHTDDRADASRQRTRTSDGGRFRFRGVLPDIQLGLVAFHLGAGRSTVEVESLGDGEERHIVIRLERPTNIKGAVDVASVAPGWGGEVTLFAVEGLSAHSESVCPIEPNGDFVLRNVSPGSKRLCIVVRSESVWRIVTHRLDAPEGRTTDVGRIGLEDLAALRLRFDVEDCAGAPAPGLLRVHIYMTEPATKGLYLAAFILMQPSTWSTLHLPPHDTLTYSISAVPASGVGGLPQYKSLVGVVDDFSAAGGEVEGVITCQDLPDHGRLVLQIDPPPGVFDVEFEPVVALARDGVWAGGNFGVRVSRDNEVVLDSLAPGAGEIYCLLREYVMGPVPITVETGKAQFMRLSTWSASSPVVVRAQRDGMPVRIRVQTMPDLGTVPSPVDQGWTDQVSDDKGNVIVSRIPWRGLYVRHMEFARKDASGSVSPFSEWRRFGPDTTEILVHYK